MKDIVMIWTEKSPVTINSGLEMPDFVLTMHNSSTCLRKFSTGNYYKSKYFLIFWGVQ